MTDDVQPYTAETLRVFLSEPFLAVLTEAARIYTETEPDVGFTLPADLWHFVAWCRALAPVTSPAGK